MDNLKKRILLLLSIVACCEAVNANYPFKLCSLIPVTPGQYMLTGKVLENITIAAVSYVNEQNPIPGHTLEIETIDTLDSAPGIVQAANEVRARGCVGVIDVSVSTLSEVAQYTLQIYNIPQISATAAASELSNRAVYPTFMRTIPALSSLGPILAQVVQYYGWTKVFVISAMDAFSISFFHEFSHAATKANIVISSSFIDPIQPDYQAQVQAVQQSFIAIVIIFAQVGDTREILIEAYNKGMAGNNSKYVWIGSSSFPNLDMETLPQDLLLGNIAVLANSVSYNSNPLVDQYKLDMERLNLAHPLGGFVYDAILSYAQVFTQYATQNNTSWNLSDLLRDLKHTTFDGVSGHVAFDSSGERLNYSYVVQNWQSNGTVPVASFYWDGNTTVLNTAVWANGEINHSDSIIQIIVILPTMLVIGRIFAAVGLSIVLVFIVLALKMKEDKNYIPTRIFIAVGNCIGFAAFVVSLEGVSKLYCSLFPALLNISFCISGGALAMLMIQKFVENYTVVHEHPPRVKYLNIVLLGIWTLFVGSNLVFLVYLMIAYRPIHTQKQIKDDFYAEQCTFKIHYLALPITIAALYFLALCINLVNSCVTSTFFSRKYSDIMNTVVSLGILVGIAVGMSFLNNDPTPTQEALIFGFVILLATSSTPVNLLFWIGRDKKEKGESTKEARNFIPLSRYNSTSPPSEIGASFDSQQLNK